MEDKNKVFLEKNKVYKNEELDVRKFNELETKIQAEIIRLILEGIYTGTKEIDVDEKYVLKCLKLTCDEFDNNAHLPLGLLVKKENDIITFTFQKRLALWFILLLFGALLFTIVGATYSAFNFLAIKDLNKDIDGDGVADINIDVDNDEIADINIDTNGDDKPDVNIDYKANREATFNIVSGDEILNPANVMENGVCVKNCDKNNDGWPETNIALTAETDPTLNLDFDDDGIADMNLDQTGDGTCDLHCDTDGDNQCNEFCLQSDEMAEVIIAINGATEIVGNTTTNNTSAQLEIVYTDMSDVVIENILPDDMEGEGTVIPTKRFTVENISPYYVQYNLKWIDVENTFIHDIEGATVNNFKYQVECEERCKELEFTETPGEDNVFIREIMIAPGQTHSYVVTFKLQGLEEPQNYDKGKLFKGKIQVVYEGE